MGLDLKYLAYALVLLYFARRVYWIVKARTMEPGEGAEQQSEALFRKAYDRTSLVLLGTAAALLLVSWQG